MNEFLTPILFRVQNLFTVLSKELQELGSDNIINFALNNGVVFAFFFFVSRFFRAYILRLGFFMFGAWVLWQVSATENILHSFDFYGGLGLMLPHLKIVEITYLLLKERTLFVYNQFVGLILLLASPFFWLYRLTQKLTHFFKAKQKKRVDKKAYPKYYKDAPRGHFFTHSGHFKQQQKAEWKKEQARQDEKYKREFREQEEKRQQKKQESYKKQEQEEKKTYSRWDSTNPYEVLGIESSATKKEIKKAYHKLAKIYHPDLALVNTEEAEEIFKKINNAYESLK